LERGNARVVSDGVLEGLARALQLDDAERQHLFDLVRLVRAVNATSANRARRLTRQRPTGGVDDRRAPELGIRLGVSGTG